MTAFFQKIINWLGRGWWSVLRPQFGVRSAFLSDAHVSPDDVAAVRCRSLDAATQLGRASVGWSGGVCFSSPDSLVFLLDERSRLGQESDDALPLHRWTLENLQRLRLKDVRVAVFGPRYPRQSGLIEFSECA